MQRKVHDKPYLLEYCLEKTKIIGFLDILRQPPLKLSHILKNITQIAHMIFICEVFIFVALFNC